MKAIILLALVAAASAAPKVADLWHPMDRINERDERIVGGSNVGALGQHPHQISLFNNGGFSCGGAIYTTNRCVTAAHCVTSNTASYVVRVGSLSQTGGNQHQVASIVRHGSYNSPPFTNDIAILRLATNIAFNNNVGPLALATGLSTGATHTVTGWGRTSHNGNTSTQLKQLNTVLQTSAVCCQRTGICHANTICFYNNVGQGTCNGDSGGPNRLGNTLVALVNFGVGNCASGSPDGMASIPGLRNWILANAATEEGDDEVMV